RRLSWRRHRLRRRRGGGDPAGPPRLRRRGGRRARAYGKLYRRRGRARGEASRPLSHERRRQGALRGVEEEVIGGCFSPSPRSSASSPSRPISLFRSASSACCCCRRALRAPGGRLPSRPSSCPRLSASPPPATR